MLFNFGRCKCLNIGHGKLDVDYNIGDTVLGKTKGLRIKYDMKVSE